MCEIYSFLALCRCIAALALINLVRLGYVLLVVHAAGLAQWGPLLTLLLDPYPDFIHEDLLRVERGRLSRL